MEDLKKEVASLRLDDEPAALAPAAGESTAFRLCR
jgi:hypothetical protein